jgi:hypothetical protein
MTDKERELDMALAEAEQENRLLRARNERLERELVDAVATEREGCHAIRQKLQNPYQHCQISAHAFDMAVADYGAAIRARGQT